MTPKVVILGSSGFIGSALLEYLQHRQIPVEGYSSSALDLTSPDSVDMLCMVIDDETILIMATRARPTGDPVEAFSNDVAMATQVARCLARCRAKKCLYFSSLSVYGDGMTNLSMTESTAIAPTSFYGIAKFTGECVIRQVGEQTGTPVVVLRSCKVYGPGDLSRSYGPVGFIESILREGKVRLFGDGEELRDHLFIRDLVQIIARLACGDQCGTYNLATGHSHSFREIIAFLHTITQREFEVVQVERNRAKVDQRVNPSKLLNALPNVRFTDLEEGLRETYQYFLALLSQGHVNHG